MHYAAIFSNDIAELRMAPQSMATHCRSRQRNAIQSNADCPLETVGFPSRFGSKALHCIAAQCTAVKRKEVQGKSKQRGLSIGNSRFSESFWLKSIAAQGVETQSTAMQGMAHQSNAD